MNLKNEIEVVMLPTNECTKAEMLVIRYKDDKLIKHTDAIHWHGINQHLYLLSNEKIKEGDWYINNSVIFRADDKFDEGNNPNQNKNNKKIIATTDKSLGLPEPSPQFIEEYIEEWNKGNKIIKVMVDYVLDINSYKGSACLKDCYILKVDKNNYITITKVKDSWNKEEVIELCFHAYNLRSTDKQVRSTKEMNEWIEQNL